MTIDTPAGEIAEPGDAVSERDILAEQVRMVLNTTSRSAVTTLVFSLVVAAVLYRLGAPILVWLAAQVALKLASFVELRLFYPERLIAAEPQRMARRLTLTQIPHAIGWAALVGVCALYGTSGQLILSLMVIGGILSGGVTTFGPLPQVHAVYLATIVAAQGVIYLIMRGHGVGNDYSAYTPLLISFFCVAIFLNTRVAGRTYQQFIRLGFVNARLARRLEQEVASTRAAQRAAEAANAAKSTFLASASHDLRQPIHALGLFLALLRRSKLTRAQSDTLRLAGASLTASREMLDALLDFSRAEAGVIAPRMQAFDLGQVLHEVEGEVAAGADDRRIVYRTRPCAVRVQSDPALVKMILLNLAANAVHYTTAGGVLIGCRRRGDRIVVEVWDTGPGIPADQWETIFSDFTQLGNPERDRRKGLGLGLAIARRLARLIDSEITLGSRMDRGSVFRFALPLAPRGPAEAVQRDQTPAALGLAAPRTGHVLVIDDDEAIRVSLGALLRDAGHSVDIAETLAEAQDCARRRAPDLLVCDFRLRAGESGAEAARRLRDQLGWRVPALLITGDTHPERVAEAAREDIEILYKPTQPVLLLDTVARLLDTRR